MNRAIARYAGTLLNHVEMLHLPGERELAAELFRVLGCRVDTKMSEVYVLVFIEPADRDPLNNIIYVSEIRPEQLELEEAFRSGAERDSRLAQGLKSYQEERRLRPQGLPHIGIRYSSFAALEEVIAKLEALGSPLRERVEGPVVFRPGDKGSMSDDLIQAFVSTDIAFSGLATLGQTVELQAQATLPR